MERRRYEEDYADDGEDDLDGTASEARA